jgi:uncharacterized membrane protein YesL
MSSFFSIDSPFFSFLSRLTDMIILNLLYILFCLPIFTIGAATSALYYQVMKMAKNEESYAFRGFVKAFRENFKKATPAWLLFLAAAIILGLDFFLSAQMSGIYFRVLQCVCIPAALAWLIAVAYTFPLFSKFENTVKNTLRNSLLMGIRHLPYTLLILLINLSPWLALLLIPQFLGIELLLMLLIWFAGAAFINGLFFHRIFANYMDPETT